MDFTPGIFKSIRTVVIRRPSRHDFSLRYFTLEFTVEAWLLIFTAYLGIMAAFLGTLYVLYRFELEAKAKDSRVIAHFEFDYRISSNCGS